MRDEPELNDEEDQFAPERRLVNRFAEHPADRRAVEAMLERMQDQKAICLDPLLGGTETSCVPSHIASLHHEYTRILSLYDEIEWAPDLKSLYQYLKGRMKDVAVAAQKYGLDLVDSDTKLGLTVVHHAATRFCAQYEPVRFRFSKCGAAQTIYLYLRARNDEIWLTGSSDLVPERLSFYKERADDAIRALSDAYSKQLAKQAKLYTDVLALGPIPDRPGFRPGQPEAERQKALEFLRSMLKKIPHDVNEASWALVRHGWPNTHFQPKVPKHV